MAERSYRRSLITAFSKISPCTGIAVTLGCYEPVTMLRELIEESCIHVVNGSRLKTKIQLFH